MAQKMMKYNPAFLSDDELKATFVARSREFDEILDHLRAADPDTTCHMLVYGPRGFGKTTLALRVAAEIRENHKFSEKYLPIVFPEELYEVATINEFWTTALTIVNGHSDAPICDTPLEALLKTAKSRNVRLLLVMENFDMLLESQFSLEDIESLQDTLSSESAIQFLATACRPFSEWDIKIDGLADLFKSIELMPLDEEQCSAIWHSVTGEEPDAGNIKALRILTGGNPRLLNIVSAFSKDRSFKNLNDNLIQLIDDHTEYFKGQLDNMAATERRVYLALTRLWKPSTAREVAEEARLDVSGTSSLLHRLMKRGKVELVDKRGRVKWYQVSERLFNIYYLMRRDGTSTSRVKALVEFMVNFYSKSNLVETATAIANESFELNRCDRLDSIEAINEIVQRLPDRESREDFRRQLPEGFQVLPSEFFELSEWVKSGHMAQFEPEVHRLYYKYLEIRYLASKRNEAEAILLRALGLTHHKEDIYFLLGDYYSNIDHEKAESAFRKVLDLTPDNADAWWELGIVLKDDGRYDEAENAFRQATRFGPESSGFQSTLGKFLSKYTDKYDDAEQAYRRMVELRPWLLVCRYKEIIKILEKLDRVTELIDYARIYVEKCDDDELDENQAIDFYIDFAARGYVSELLELLQQSRNPESLEPIITALQLLLNQDVKAPREILEVANDIVVDIKHRINEIESYSGGDEPSD